MQIDFLISGSGGTGRISPILKHIPIKIYIPGINFKYILKYISWGLKDVIRVQSIYPYSRRRPAFSSQVNGSPTLGRPQKLLSPAAEVLTHTLASSGICALVAYTHTNTQKNTNIHHIYT